MADDIQKGRILVIDDLQEIRHFLKQRLNDFGYHVEEAEDGQKGLEIARSGNVDIIILDYEMPGMNGVETARQLKSGPDTASIPIILLSSFPFGKELVQEIKVIGINAYMMKPYEFDDLLIKINQIIHHQNRTFMEPNEKRGTKRFKTSFSAHVEINGNRFPAKLVNVSREGVCMLLPHKEKVGTQMKVYFENPDVLPPPLMVSGTKNNYVGIAKMIWISSKQQNGMYLTGLEMQSM